MCRSVGVSVCRSGGGVMKGVLCVGSVVSENVLEWWSGSVLEWWSGSGVGCL